MSNNTDDPLIHNDRMKKEVAAFELERSNLLGRKTKGFLIQYYEGNDYNHSFLSHLEPAADGNYYIKWGGKTYKVITTIHTHADFSNMQVSPADISIQAQFGNTPIKILHNRTVYLLNNQNFYGTRDPYYIKTNHTF